MIFLTVGNTEDEDHAPDDGEDGVPGHGAVQAEVLVHLASSLEKRTPVM